MQRKETIGENNGFVCKFNPHPDFLKIITGIDSLSTSEILDVK